MRIFIAIPSPGEVHAWFAQALAAMIVRTLKERTEVEIETRVEIGKLPMVRNVLLAKGIEAKADFMLWLDSDHVFPDWTLLRLLMVDREIVGINQPSRTRPHVATARGGDGERLASTEEQARAGLVERVSQIGFPVVLMDMAIVPKLTAQAKKEDRPGIFPMFAFTMTGDPNRAGGEDTFFCQRCTEAGIAIHVDHQLSFATVHMATLPVGMRDISPA